MGVIACCFVFVANKYPKVPTSTGSAAKTTATKEVSTNKAERTAVAEALEGKVADMGKMTTSSANPPKGNGKNRSKTKGKKDHIMGGGSVSNYSTADSTEV